MFTLESMQSLWQARPFVPFRLWISDGSFVDVRSPEVGLLGRRFAVVGLLDANAKDTLLDRWTTVWYMHVTRAEQIDPGPPPFSASSDGSPSTTPTPT